MLGSIMNKKKSTTALSSPEEPRRKIPKDSNTTDEEELSQTVCNMNITTARSPSPTRSVTPSYMKEGRPMYSDALRQQDQPREEQTTDQSRQSATYEVNKRRSAILWLDEPINLADLADDIATSLNARKERCLLGLQKDTRVKSRNKYIIVFSNGEYFDDALQTGLTVQGRRVRLRELKPRPPPSKRAFLPNFPVAASPAELAVALKEIGLNPLSIQARTLQNTKIRTGGWSVYVQPDSAEPDIVPFDEVDYAIVWGRRRNNHSTANTETATGDNIAIGDDPTDKRKNAEGDTAENTTNTSNTDHEANKTPNETNTTTDNNNTHTKEISDEIAAGLGNEEFSKVKSKKQKKKERQLKEAKSTRHVKENQHTLNERLRGIPRKDRMIRHNSPLASYEPEPYQVIYTGFPKDTTITAMRNYIASHGIFPVCSQLLTCPRTGPTILVSFTDTESALVQTILANSDDRPFYEHVDDDGHSISTRGHFGSNIDTLQGHYDNLIGKS